MRVEKSEYEGKIFGVKLISENNEDEEILMMFWNSGAKVNSIRRSKEINLEIVFKVNKERV